MELGFILDVVDVDEVTSGANLFGSSGCLCLRPQGPRHVVALRGPFSQGV